MRKIYIIALALLSAGTINAQEEASAKNIDTVVVTGQYQPQSIKNSVYQVRVISNERIRLSGATNVQQVLNNQLGFRFSNDNTLGTTDVQLMGMSGRNVKILLDGVPMIDRGDTRESLSQVDINTIQRIEIVEGPMSIIYGSDALAGVINIITAKNKSNSFSINAKAQEETAVGEYYPFSYKGSHNQSIQLGWRKNGWFGSAGGSHNDHDGFGGDDYGRVKTWKPKEQWLGNIKLGYSSDVFNIYYRLDALDETITSRGPINMNSYMAVDQRYISSRFTHQAQGGWKINNKLQLNGILAYTNYERSTKTVKHDFQTSLETPGTDPGQQDVATLNSFAFRPVLNYKASEKISFQPGIDINYEKASGGRINGEPSIADYAFFVSAELKPTSKINIRPGLRFIENSVYDAPPVIPSLLTKFALSKTLDLRLSYAYGFRSPALRELYFYFHDANHDIDGNPNLKAEHSNNFNGSLSWTPPHKGNMTFSSAFAVFYNVFNNQIDLASSAANPNLSTYFNINRSKTTGATWENKFGWKNLDATIGFSYIGKYSSLYDDASYIKEDDREFLWTPEVNSNIIYRISKLKTSLGLFYKYSGKRPSFAYGVVNNQDVIYVAETENFHWADFTVTTAVNKFITVNAGVKNIFDVTNLSNTAAGGGAHSTAGPLPVSYGRSYFLGVALQWSKR